MKREFFPGFNFFSDGIGLYHLHRHRELIAVADHSVTRQAARATVYVEEGLQRGLQGNIPAMVQALIEAEQIDPFDQIYSAKVFAMAAYVAKAASWGSEDNVLPTSSFWRPSPVQPGR